MDLIEQITKHKHNLNDNQNAFLQISADLFEKINRNFIGPHSFVSSDNDRLTIFLEHILNPTTHLQVRVDKYEIYITVGEIGKSMFLAFPKSNDKDLLINAKEYLRHALNGDYIIKRFSDKNGDVVKLKLIWHNDFLPSTDHISGTPIKIIQNLFTKNKTETEINPSSFW